MKIVSCTSVVKKILYLSRIKNLAFRAVRLWIRGIYLWMIGTPLLVAYPLTVWNEKLHQEWLQWCVYGVEMSGAAIVKLFQWASSRPDMFGEEFCALFKKLQDEVRPSEERRAGREVRSDDRIVRNN